MYRYVKDIRYIEKLYSRNPIIRSSLFVEGLLFLGNFTLPGLAAVQVKDLDLTRAHSQVTLSSIVPSTVLSVPRISSVRAHGRLRRGAITARPPPFLRASTRPTN
jgi:hypothetical protein